MFGSKRFSVPVLALGIAAFLFLFAMLVSPAVVHADPDQVILFDFEEFNAGDVVNSYTKDGITVTIEGSPGAPTVFDSSNPTCNDIDLGSPNEDFGGPGIGDGGKAGTPGENSVAQGKILIIQDPFSTCIPNDYNNGGTITFTFPSDSRAIINSISLLDIELQEGAVVDFLESDGTVLHSEIGADLGDNSFQELTFTDTFTASVAALRVTLTGSGSITGVEFEPDAPNAITLQSLQAGIARPALAWLLAALAILTLPAAALLTRRARRISVD